MPKSAIILAAGRGERFRPVTDSIPKPLVQLGGKTLLDWQLELLELSGIERVIINCCYLKDLIKTHVKSRKHNFKEIVFSEEETALETGGGIKKALSFFNDEPFFALNSDVVMHPQTPNILNQLRQAADKRTTLRLILLLQARAGIVGLDGSRGDFFCNEYGLLSRRRLSEEAPFVFTGVQLIYPEVFEGIENSIFSMNLVYNKMLESEQQQIAGVINTNGIMLHVGDVTGHKQAESHLHDKQLNALLSKNAIPAQS
jgi:MurNAc alpha-1-phosphate uridylyltransferase